MSELCKSGTAPSFRLSIIWFITALSIIFLTIIFASDSRGDEVADSLVKNESLEATKLCWLQERLREGCFYKSSVDGILGPDTLKAIEKYKSQFGLSSIESATGIVFEHIMSNQSIPDKPISTILPKNGQIFQYPIGNAIAPLEIYTSDAGLHYFVKLTPPNSTQAVLTIFIRSGQHISTNVPLGRYEIKYAVGATWYNKQCLFGRDTSFFAADRKFDFKKNGNRISGYRVELILQVHGNLPTK